jgi:very-short-patch-repair endonuclease
LWKALRNRALGGYKFRRQHPIGPYVVDFACVDCKLVIEVDGQTHLPRKSADEKRAQLLEKEGWCVIRFWNTEIYEELEPVKEAIYRQCVARAKAR